jgi:hypothetical protein
MFVKASGLPEGKQPDMLSAEDLELLLKNSGWVKRNETDETDRSA